MFLNCPMSLKVTFLTRRRIHKRITINTSVLSCEYSSRVLACSVIENVTFHEFGMSLCPDSMILRTESKALFTSHTWAVTRLPASLCVRCRCLLTQTGDSLRVAVSCCAFYRLEMLDNMPSPMTVSDAPLSTTNSNSCHSAPTLMFLMLSGSTVMIMFNSLVVCSPSMYSILRFFCLCAPCLRKHVHAIRVEPRDSQMVGWRTSKLLETTN